MSDTGIAKGGWTKGPWRLTGPDDFGDYTIQPLHQELAIAAVVNGAVNGIIGAGDEHTANAHLIASAPEMYEALKDILAANAAFRAQTPDWWQGDPLQAACDRAAAALRRAEGRED